MEHPRGRLHQARRRQDHPQASGGILIEATGGDVTVRHAEISSTLIGARGSLAGSSTRRRQPHLPVATPPGPCVGSPIDSPASTNVETNTKGAARWPDKLVYARR
ncbi:MAG: hypothetical protein R3F14_29650 [Polyangiaceae bacterium]